MNIAYTLGRILLPIIFIAAGVQHLLDIQGLAKLVAGTGLPIPSEIEEHLPAFLKDRYTALAYLLAAVEVVCGLMILVGLKARWGALVLIVYTACTIFFVHHFWDMASANFTAHMNDALKHLAIMGGLLLLVGGAPAPTGLDRQI